MTTSPVDDDRSGKFVYDSTDTPRPPLHVVAPAATANVAFHVVTLCGTSIEISRAVRRRVGCEVYPHMLGCSGCAQRRPDLYPKWEAQPEPVHYRIGADMRSGVPVVCGQFVARGIATEEWDDVTCPQCAGARPKIGTVGDLPSHLQPPPVLTVHELQDIAGKHLRNADAALQQDVVDTRILGAHAQLSIAATLLADHLDRQPIPCEIVDDDPPPEPWIVIHRGLSNDVALCGATPPADGSGLPLMLGGDTAWAAVNCNRCLERRHLVQSPTLHKRDRRDGVALCGAKTDPAKPLSQGLVVTVDDWSDVDCQACRACLTEMAKDG